MQRIRVKVSGSADQHMLQEIVEGAVSLDGEMDVLSSQTPGAEPPDVLLVAAAREEMDTLDGGGEVVVLDRRQDHVDLYVLRLFDRVRGSVQLANAIRRLASHVMRRS